ncbi:Non-specific serine/threonine protein kinase [Bertholletia excelsa]
MDDGEAPVRQALALLLTIAIAFSLLQLSTGDDVSITTAISIADKSDADVMFNLAKALNPPGWNGSNPCIWTGISCDKEGHIITIDLSSKGLVGELPPELTTLSHLKGLLLQRNHISGTLPSLTDMPSLQKVMLEGNNFSSVPQSFLKGLTSLVHLSIGENINLPPWPFPEGLKDSSMLTEIEMEAMGLTGQIPDIFGSFPTLQELRLSYNNLTGPLPPSLAKTEIVSLWLNSQKQGLSGRLDVLSEMKKLYQVWLHNNKFFGPIPDLSQCDSLFDLSIRDNLLTGPVHPSLMGLPKLGNISLQNNKFQGPVPVFRPEVKVTLGNTNSFCNVNPGPCDPQVTTLLDIAGGFGYPMGLAESWTGNNPCDKWKSVTCNAKGNVVVLNFAKQGLGGKISPSIANLTALTKLYLNDNNLTGPIPPSLADLNELQEIDISNNDISGPVPKFPAAMKLKADGNPFIGKDMPVQEETVTTPSGSAPFTDQTAKQPSEEGSNNTTGGSQGASIQWWMLILIVIVALLVVSALSAIIYRRSQKKNRFSKVSKKEFLKPKRSPRSGELPSRSSIHSDIQVYDGGNVEIPIDILREVTDSFNEGNIVGKGGFGVVYSGRLHDGTRIAVKRMESTAVSSKGKTEFEAEIAVLSRVRHRHLVTLHGYCVNGNERLLVYEYMPEGTLAQHLFGYREMGVPALTWKQRVTIALDVARGIEYLHGLAQQSFIHRDLKPSNILLGEDMRAKVSDFGLVKSAPTGNYSVETRLAGTFGYMAPEYASTGRVTTKVDVFAFGVILMEIITGRKALDEALPEEESHLVPWFRQFLNDRDAIRDQVDPTLVSDNGETFDSICRVAELAGHCTAHEPQQRPDMGHAVNVLSPLVEQWRPASPEREETSGINYSMNLSEALQKWRNTDGNSSSVDTDFFKGYGSTNTTSRGPAGVPNSFTSRDAR